jgi:hypothetical protein
VPFLMEEKTMTYARTTTVDAAPAGDVVKQAVLDVDTDLTGIYANLNTHETATTDIHGAGSGTLVSTTGTQTLTAKTISGATITGAVDCSGATLTSPTVSGATITGGTIAGVTFSSPTLTSASDTTYGASWDGVTDVAPSKNAVYDKINAMISDTTYGASWDGVTDVAPSKNAVYDRLTTVGVGFVATAAATSADWNDLPTEFHFSGIAPKLVLQATTTGNQPSSGQTDHFYVQHLFFGAQVTQIAWPYTIGDRNIWFRARYEGTWTAWAKILDANDISDTAYGSGWNGVTTIAPSKNAVYDKVELLAPKDDPTFTTNATSPKFTQSAAVNYFSATFTGSNLLGNNTLGTTVDITTNVTWTESSDTSGVFSKGTFTAPANGLYYIAFFISPSENNTITIADSGLMVDGTVSVSGSHFMPNQNFTYGGAGVTSTAIVYLTTSQYVRGYAGVLNDDATKTTEADGWMFGYRIL